MDRWSMFHNARRYCFLQVNDLVVFGRRISASEALQGGMLTRCLWPDRFAEQLRSIVKDIAAQPQQVTHLAIALTKDNGDRVSWSPA